jgi:uncharacterized membrane protein required for colicin V production
VLFDIVIVAYVVLQGYLGLRFGFFRRLIHLAGFYLGLLLARAISPAGAQSLGWNTGSHPPDGHFGLFLLVLFGIVVAAELLALAYGSLLDFFNAMVFDRFLGAGTGALMAVLELSLLLYLFGHLLSTAPPGGTGRSDLVLSSADQISHSFLAHGLKTVEPLATFVFLPVLPNEPGKYWTTSYT